MTAGTVVTRGGNYTKHIYIGSQRIVSKLGDLDSYGQDPRRIAYAGSEVDGASVDYVSKYKETQNTLKNKYADFEVPFNGKDNDDYVNGGGFCCDDNPKLRAGAIGNGNDNPEIFQYYYHSDHLGSTSLITDLDGYVVQHVEYVPFGEVFIEERNNRWNTPYLFNAKELDEETGLYYYGARYYDPRIALFLGVDPLSEKYPNFSVFSYCANNPIKYIDPTGMDWFKNEEGTVQYHENETEDFDNWVHLSADKYDKSVIDAIGNDIMKTTEGCIEEGWNKFIAYFENTDLGKDYFQNAACKNYNDNASGIMTIITKLPGIKRSIRISQMTHDWVDGNNWSRKKNTMEHYIGMFLVADSYGPYYADFIGSSNELRGLFINDRQQGQMIDALSGEGDTAFEWRDLYHNQEGLKKWRIYRMVPTPKTNPFGTTTYY
jgi:RHS repeat-associated protein